MVLLRWIQPFLWVASALAVAYTAWVFTGRLLEHKKLERRVMKLKPILPRLDEIRAMAESCGKQLNAWTSSIESSPVQGKRHLTTDAREEKRTIEAVKNFRLSFLKGLKPEHPLFNSQEARQARGETLDS